MKVERASREILEKLVDIYLEGYKGLEQYSYTHPDDVKAYMDWLWRRDPEGILVAKEGEKIIGFVAGDAGWFSKRERKKVGAIHEIVVLPTYRGRGVGRALMEEILRYFKSKNLPIAELWVGDENSRAIEFYRRLGFEENGRYNYWVRFTLNIY